MIIQHTSQRIFLGAVFSILVLIPSCSRQEPRIHYGFMEKVYYLEAGTIEARHSFFVLVEDNDGAENLSELYLYHDWEGLRWFFTAEDWVSYNDDGKNWVGSRHIIMHSAAPLPSGEYRAVLVNKGGEKTERTFTFDIPEDSPHPFPSFSIANGMYQISSQYPLNRLLAYDEKGDMVETIPISPIDGDQGTIASLNLPQRVLSLALWASNEEYRISALTGAVTVR